MAANRQALKDLMEMGISSTMAEAALLKTGSTDVSALLDWIGQHQSEEPQLAEWLKTRNSEPEQSEGESISHLVNGELNVAIQSMGFSKNVAEKAIFMTGNNSQEKALQWIEENKNNPDFEEQLRMVGQPKSTLTEEEAKIKLQQLQQRIRENRKKKQQADALERQKNRMKSGKQLVEAKRMAEQMQIKRQLELDKIEKQRDEDYKRQLLIQMKRERCEKLGIPFNENEFVRQTTVKKVELSRTERIGVQMQQVKVGNFAYPEKSKTFFDTAAVYIGNIIKNPTDPKYRRINTTNNAYQNRIAQAFAGPECLLAIGFRPEDNFLVLDHPDIEQLKEIVKALERYSASV